MTIPFSVSYQSSVYSLSLPSSITDVVWYDKLINIVKEQNI